MNAILLRNLQMRRASSLQSFKEYRALEAQNPQQASVTSDGALLEFETLELRLHPPNVVIDNDTYDDMTVITIDSANRPGTLIEVVQCLTELNLSIRKARISSDGGWFVDEFFVTETPRGKVLHQHKLELIRKVLSVGSDSTLSAHQSEPVAVFELSGRDQKGLLANVLSTTMNSGCEVQSLAVWTYHNQVAMVMAVADRATNAATASQSRFAPSHHAHTHHTQPHALRIGSAPNALANSPGGGNHHHSEPDPQRMTQLSALLVGLLGGEGAAHGAWEVVVGEVHHERRLHHLLLAEEERSWEAQLMSGHNSLAASLSLGSPLGPQGSASLSPMHSHTGAASRTTSQPGSSTPQAPVQVSSDGTVATATAADTSPTTSQQQSGLSGPTTSGGATGGPVVGIISNGQVVDTQLASSTFANLQSQQQVTEAGGLDNSQNGGDMAAMELARTRVPQLGTTGLSNSGSGVVQPFAYIPAPTAIPASDFVNLHAYMDPANAAQLLRADVRIQHSPLLKYYLVTITCKDRNKLFFDTVCTLADMQYDVYHGAIDSEGDQASQLFYVRPRTGEVVLDEMRVRQLAYMLECAVQRRFPRGLRVHVQTQDRKQVAAIFSSIANAGLSVTRAEVRTLLDGRAILDLTLTDTAGAMPPSAAVQRVCEAAGGVQADELDPLMAVAGVGGAAAAAATNMRVPSLLPTASGMYGLGSQVVHAHAHSHGTQSILAMSTHSAAPTYHNMTHTSSGALGTVPVPLRMMQGKFQFTIPSSADRQKRGPMSVSSTQSNVM